MAMFRFFEERVATGRPMVLATVFETAGSTYSKAGDRMIIDGEGNFCGMLSGGCLEGDLVERARAVISTGQAQTATYDLGADDELWGLGVGCDGTMRVLLQALMPEQDYQPFSAIAQILNGGHRAIAVTVIAADTLAMGSLVLIRDGNVEGFGVDEQTAASFATDSDAAVGIRQADTPHGTCQVLFSSIAPAPALLVLGAGLDSEPVVRFADELGWRTTATDHRPGYIEGRHYPDSTIALCCEAATVDASVDLSDFDMAIVMSHHLVSDRTYLEQLARSNIGYIGLLGPAARRDRLLGELGALADSLRDRLHGPAGMMLGGRGPASIALEIVAEMQKYLAKRR